MKRLTAAFYKLPSSGAEPVRAFIKQLEKKDRDSIGYDIQSIEYGWPIGMPVCKPLGQGLYEVRSSLSGNRIARVIFCIERDIMFLLHIFIKKTQKTPEQELNLAKERYRRIKNEKK